MNRRCLAAVLTLGTIAVLLAMPAQPRAQTPKADWLTDGGDPQRTAWQRHETILTKTTVSVKDARRSEEGARRSLQEDRRSTRSPRLLLAQFRFRCSAKTSADRHPLA